MIDFIWGLYDSFFLWMGTVDGTKLIAYGFIFSSVVYGIKRSLSFAYHRLIATYSRSIEVSHREPSYRRLDFWLAENLDKSIFPVKNFITRELTYERVSDTEFTSCDGGGYAYRGDVSKLPETTEHVTSIIKMLGVNTIFLKMKGLPIIRVVMERLEEKNSFQGDNALPFKMTLTFFSRDPNIIDHFLETLSQTENHGAIKLYDHENDGSGYSQIRLLNRHLDGVILNPGVKEYLINSIDGHLSKETKDFYKSLGVAYKYGILLYGPPGCGKTSLAVALRNHYQRPLFKINLTAVYSDSMLNSLFRNIPLGSLVLLEDIDCAGVEAVNARSKTEFSGSNELRPAPADRRSRPERVYGQDTKEEVASDYPKSDSSDGFGVTLSGLLNCLDGIVPLQNIIIIMTTNHPDKLDPALIREGRINIRVAIEPLIEQAQFDYVEHIFGTKLDRQLLTTRHERLEPCKLQQLCVSSLGGGGKEEAFSKVQEALFIEKSKVRNTISEISSSDVRG